MKLVQEYRLNEAEVDEAIRRYLAERLDSAPIKVDGRKVTLAGQGTWGTETDATTRRLVYRVEVEVK